MDPNRPYLSAGQRMKAARKLVGLSTRDVQRKSEQIASEKRNQEFYVSHAWVTDIEQGKFVPTLFKLYSLGAIYDKSFAELASYFELRIADLGRDRASIGVPRTHLVDREGDAEIQSVPLPVEFKPEFRLGRTNLLANVVEKWNEVPLGLVQHLDLRKSLYGYIGLEDHTLAPLIRPGSLVRIDPSQTNIVTGRWRTEFERPIYFIEVRDGYLCSWCQLEKGQLIVIPHPQSRLAIRNFDHPSQAEVLGRVTGVAMRIAEEEKIAGGTALR